MKPITDEEVAQIAARLTGRVRPSWPEEIREVVNEFVALRCDERDWFDGE